jgi:hypothetical protein
LGLLAESSPKGPKVEVPSVAVSAPNGKPCAFCGERMSKATGNQVTKEHALPLWIMPWMGDSSEGGVTHTIREGTTGTVLRQWTTDTLDLVARKVCRRCNNGWMNDLETLVRPHLIPLLEGQRRVLDAPALRILSAWAVKTALSLALSNTHATPISVGHYRAMADAKLRPPAGTWVWIASYKGWRHAFHHPSSLTLTDSSGSYEGYAAVVSLTRPIFQVLGYPPHLGVENRRFGEPAQATAQMWPLNGLTHWPTPTPLDDKGLTDLATMWGSEG